MSVELADTHASEGAIPSTRDYIESAIAAHTSGPDVSSAVSGAVEHRDRELRQRDRQTHPSRFDNQGERSDQLRQHIRDAFTQERLKSSDQASAPIQPTKPGEVAAPGAPASWDSTAKPYWPDLPAAVRLAIQRDHAGFANATVNPAMEAVLAPARQEYTKHGLKDHEAVGRLMEWEAAVRNPATRIQAARALMQQYGMTLQDLAGGPQNYQPQASYSDPAAVHAEGQRLAKFAQGRGHFEQVRESMGLLLSRFPNRYSQSDGTVNLDALYSAACKVEGLNTNPVPPRPRAPAAQGDRRAVSVRESIRAAMRG